MARIKEETLKLNYSIWLIVFDLGLEFLVTSFKFSIKVLFILVKFKYQDVSN